MIVNNRDSARYLSHRRRRSSRYIYIYISHIVKHWYLFFIDL